METSTGMEEKSTEVAFSLWEQRASVPENRLVEGTAETLKSSNETEMTAIGLEPELYERIAYLIIGIVGITGNGIVALVILKTPTMRSTFPNMFIANQSAIDLMASFFIITTTYIRDINWVKPNLGKELFCRVWLTNLPLWGMLFSSIYNLVLLTAERYFAIVHPLNHSRMVTKKRVCCSCFIIWFIGPAFYASYIIPTSDVQGQSCNVFANWPKPQWRKACVLIIELLTYYVPLTVLTSAYGHIAYVLHRAGIGSEQRQEDSIESAASANRKYRLLKARKNVLKTLALVGFGFALCVMWNAIYFTLYGLGVVVDFDHPIYHFTVIAVFCNCCLNPFIYAFKYKQFQTALKKLICKATKYNESGSVVTLSTVGK